MEKPAKNTDNEILDAQTATHFFLTYLNKVFYAKMHLVERLPELVDQADFIDLKHAIEETWDDINKQIIRMDEIYVILNTEPSTENFDNLFEFVEDGFNEIHLQSANPKLRDMSILFYMSLIESIEAASFKILQIAAEDIPNRQVKQLIGENFDESKEDKELFMQITSRYKHLS